MKITAKVLFYLKLGARNILKYKKRSLQVGVVICIGGFVMTTMGGFTDGMYDKLLKDMFEGTSHAKVFRKGYYEKQEISPLELSIEGYRGIIGRISSAGPGVKISPSISAGTVVSFKDNSLNLVCQGVEPYSGKDADLFPAYRTYAGSVREGRFFKNNSDKGVLISSYAARNLACGLGESIILFTADSYGSFNAVELEVIGIFKTGYKDKDENVCIADLQSVQGLVGLENAVTEISLYFNNLKESESFGRRISGIIRENNLEYMDWKELLGVFVWALKIGNIFNFIIYIIFIIVAAVGIMNTVLISIMNRMRDIGTFRALGFTLNDVSAMIITEVTLLGIIGSAIGIAIGVGLVYYFSVVGIPISDEMKDTMGSFLSSNRIYTTLKINFIVFPFFVSCLVPVLSSLYPLSLMRKMHIKEALGFL
ncbi:MAG: ABC transporter permease [Endomicrobiales bacterium]|nr:ABC transporter permease [Endomicrobiales bacterium]